MNNRITHWTTRFAVFAIAGALVACGGTEADFQGDGFADEELGNGAAPGDPGDEEQDPVIGDDEQDPVDEQDPIDEEDPVDEEEDPFDPLVAPFDNDSLRNPAVSELLRITGLRELEYIDQISANDGDAEDWVEFQLPNNSNSAQQIQMALDCQIEGEVEGVQARATIFEDGEEDLTLRTLCNEGLRNLTVDNTKVQTVRVYFSIPPEAQTLVTYRLQVVGFR